MSDQNNDFNTPEYWDDYRTIEKGGNNKGLEYGISEKDFKQQPENYILHWNEEEFSEAGPLSKAAIEQIKAEALNYFKTRNYLPVSVLNAMICQLG